MGNEVLLGWAIENLIRNGIDSIKSSVFYFRYIIFTIFVSFLISLDKDKLSNYSFRNLLCNLEKIKLSNLERMK